jgi:hypothetical protein
MSDDATGHEQDTDLRDSTPNANGPDGAAGGMGVSSERVGPTGPGQVGTDGVRDTSAAPVDPDDPDAPPEQHAGGGDDVQPEGIAPAAGYPAKDPRSAEKPYSES